MSDPTVTLTNLDTGITATKVTDENGSFEFATVIEFHCRNEPSSESIQKQGAGSMGPS